MLSESDAVLDQVHQIAAHRLDVARRRVEFADVGAAAQITPGAGDDDRAHLVVADRGLQMAGQGDPHLLGQRVDRRIVEGEDGDLAVTPV